MTPSFPEPPAEQPAGCPDAGQAETAGAEMNSKCQAEETPAEQTGQTAPAAGNSGYRPCFNISPDYIIDLPDGDSFTTAIEKKLRLPPVTFGKRYECVIKLFTLNNSFEKRIEILSVGCINRNDISAELDPDKRRIHIFGLPNAEGTIQIKLSYLTKNTSFFQRISPQKEQYCIINLAVQADPVMVMNRAFKERLQKGDFEGDMSNGRAGETYANTLELIPDTELLKHVTFTSAELSPDCGLNITPAEPGVFKISGTPVREADLKVIVCYDFITETYRKAERIAIPFIHIARDPAYDSEEKFVQGCQKNVPPRTMAGTEIEIKKSFQPLIYDSFIEILSVELTDKNFTVNYDPVEKEMTAKGTPDTPGQVSAVIRYIVKTKLENIGKEISMQILNVTPDPKTLWKDLPTDPTALYQVENAEMQIIQAGDRVIVGASKRGRSHAHEGKFRDDSFKFEYIPETGWYIVVVSDGAGSARYSRAGSKISCETFCEIMKAKLSSAEVNKKIDDLPETDRENALKNSVLNAVYQCLSKIDEESKAQNCPRKDFSATFLGYIMKQINGQWLIVSMGIGDGIMALIDRNDQLTLMSEPDGGEFVGQTRFITMNEVWQDNPASRVRITRTDDFGIIMSMTDGVSDPKFETDNNLKDVKLWLDLWNDITSQVPLSERSEETAQKLCGWLDFWAKGNHDDRTIVLVY